MKKEKKKFILLKMMAMMTPSCEVIGQRVSESFDRKLSWRERLSIRIHNLGCVVCERYRRQMLALHKVLNRFAATVHEVDDPSTSLPDEAKERIKTMLRNEIL